MMENMVVYKGPVQEVSMPATEFGKVTTQETSRNLFACTRYKHPRQIPTQRVMPDFGLPSSARFLTTSMLLANGDRLEYTKEARKPMVDATNMKETQRMRKTSLPEHGFGAIVPRFSGDRDLGKRYWETTTRTFFNDKTTMTNPSPPRSPLSSHPNPPLPATVGNANKGGIHDKGAGFSYDNSITYNPIPFPDQQRDGGDPWGRTRTEKKGRFGEHHIISTVRLFQDARGIDPPRLGITVPGDTTVWPRDPLMPVGKPRKCVIAYAAKDNLTRRNGVHIWDDYAGT
mmetsp:Transcript_47971/g.150512  ORF Transcript_47971/g.150512 Transcript_47971/m.150512 type:complete len:286 (-) Transcript_47971:34-891(-)